MSVDTATALCSVKSFGGPSSQWIVVPSMAAMNSPVGPNQSPSKCPAATSAAATSADASLLGSVAEVPNAATPADMLSSTTSFPEQGAERPELARKAKRALSFRGASFSLSLSKASVEACTVGTTSMTSCSATAHRSASPATGSCLSFRPATEVAAAQADGIGAVTSAAAGAEVLEATAASEGGDGPPASARCSPTSGAPLLCNA
mmetsp:Transcript_166794/g.535366  ORF Transcript_166794/g.535366 Transcript_166794/m.535366 type:complete len:205 (-) Transcript_166794:2430-3044(-)